MCWGCRMNVCSAQVKRRGVGGTIWILGGGTRSAAAVGQSPSHLWQGTVAARSLALTTESAKLARSESAMSSHQRLRRGNAARLGCFEGSASPPACATPGQQPRAAAAGWLAGYDLPGLGLLASVGAHYSTLTTAATKPAVACVDAGAGSRCNRRPPARRPRMYRRPAVVVRGRIGKHGAAGLAALLA